MTAITLERETNNYWNLIKDAGNEVKLALIKRLSDALAPAVAEKKTRRKNNIMKKQLPAKQGQLLFILNWEKTAICPYVYRLPFSRVRRPVSFFGNPYLGSFFFMINQRF